MIQLIQTEYILNGKKWELVETKESTIFTPEYNRYITSMKFFRNLGGKESLKKSAHKTVLTSVSPDKDQKIVREFNFN